MKISSIKIAGYKNVDDTTIDLGRFNALVALNNYGKSNLIEAIDFSIDFIKSSNKTKESMMRNMQSIPINTITAGKDFIFEISFDSVFENEICEVNYSYSFEWIKKDNKGCKIVSETLKIKKEKDVKYSTYINRKDSKQLYLTTKTGRCDRKIVIDDNNLIINKLGNFDDLFYLEIIKEINEIKLSSFALDDIDNHFSTGYVMSQVLGSEEKPTMSEIPCIADLFFMLKKDYKNKYDLLISSIKDLLPDIEYIEPIEIDFKKRAKLNSKFVPFDLPEKVYDIRVKIKTNNQETSVKNLSSGSKRIFYILVSAIVADFSKSNLLCFEELENSIHPALLQRLLVIISQLTENTPVLITSHSPYLVKYLNLNDIFIGIPNKDGIASFRRIKKSKQNKLIQYAKDSESNIGDFVFDMLISGFNDDDIWNDYI